MKREGKDKSGGGGGRSGCSRAGRGPRVPGLVLKRGLYYYQAPMVGGVRPNAVALQTADFAQAVVKMADLQRSNFVAERAEPLEKLTEEFMRAKQAGGKHRKTTLKSARPALKRFRKYFRCPVGSITGLDLEGWRDAMLAERKMRYDEEGVAHETEEPQLSTASISSYMRMAQSFLSWLVARNRLVRNPFDDTADLFPKSLPTRRSKFCTKELRDRLITLCEHPDLKAVLFIGFHAGLRRQEILNIRPDWFLTDAGGYPTHLRIMNDERFLIKDGEWKTVPLSDALAEFLHGFGIDREPFLIAPEIEAGKAEYRWEWKHRWETFMRQQGCPWVTPHTMRHTWFTLLLSKPSHLQPSTLQLSRWSGDSAGVIERSYAHLIEDRSLINVVD